MYEDRQSWKTIAHVTNSREKTGKQITKMAEFLKTLEAPSEFTSDKAYVDQISFKLSQKNDQ